MKAHKIADDEIWEVRRGGSWAVKHAALERIATEKNITFDIPHFAEKDGMSGVVALLVVGHLGDKSEWSIGEAAPNNNKNAYPYAMAEKRGKDRVIIKLLASHGSHGAIYSDAEADDFVQKRQNPHVTRPEDILPPTEYDQHGEVIDNIPHGDGEIERMSKAQAREEFAKIQKELRFNVTVESLKKWGDANANRIATLPIDWAEMIRGIYSEHRDDLRKERAA